MGQRSRNSFLDIGRVFEPDPAHADGFGHCREIRVLEVGAEWEKTGGFLLELDEAERAVVEHDHLNRQAELHQTEKITHQHRKPAVA